MREKFSIPVNKITVEDDSGTEVDETVFAELSTVQGICFVIKESHDNGKYKEIARVHIAITAVLISDAFNSLLCIKF